LDVMEAALTPIVAARAAIISFVTSSVISPLTDRPTDATGTTDAIESPRLASAVSFPSIADTQCVALPGLFGTRPGGHLIHSY
jgi:hypothetical protein